MAFMPHKAPPVQDGILDCVGHTPMLRLRRFAPELQLFAKLEYLNPGGSVKDRVALGILQAAAAQGLLAPGATVIEATAGNTGVGLALACQALGYRCIIVMTDKYSQEKMMLVKALGAELVVLPRERGMDGAMAHSELLAQSIPGSFLTHQYENPQNPLTHYQTTAEEIWEQMQGQVDGIAIGAGSGGTFTGITQRLKELNPALQAVCVQPAGSVFAGGPLGEWQVEGLGSTNVPGVLHLQRADGIQDVADADSVATARQLIALEGCLVGPSSGCNAFAARLLAQRLGPGSRVVTLFPDGAERYMSKFPVADLTQELQCQPSI